MAQGRRARVAQDSGGLSRRSRGIGPWLRRTTDGRSRGARGVGDCGQARVRAMSASSPDLILCNGRIHTVDATDSMAEALAIRDGEILAVGRSSDVVPMRGKGTQVVDLKGRAVVPGFVDGHPHLNDVGLRMVLPSFDNPKSIDEVVAIVRAEVARRKPGEWIVFNPLAGEPEAFSYPKVFGEGGWPTLHDLDKVSPDNPVYIQPQLMLAPGAAVANSAALRAAGLDRNVAGPDGVVIGKDDAGELTGVFLDYNFPKVMPDTFGGFHPGRAFFPMIPPITEDIVHRGIEAAMAAFNQAGITAIYEGHGIPRGPQRAYLDLWTRKELTVRTYFVISYPV